MANETIKAMIISELNDHLEQVSELNKALSALGGREMKRHTYGKRSDHVKRAATAATVVTKKRSVSRAGDKKPSVHWTQTPQGRKKFAKIRAMGQKARRGF